MKSSRIMLWVLALLVAVALLFVGKSWLERSLNAPGPHDRIVALRVQPGDGLNSVLLHLQALGALRDARAVQFALRSSRRSPVIRAGEYEIAARATPNAILEQLAAGRVVLQSLTIVEGSRFSDFRRLLEQQSHLRQTLRGRSDDELMAAIGHAGEHPEGRFFPDTYRFAQGSSDRDILQLAYRQMSDVLTRSWADRGAQLPLRTPYEALTLASVVEKETGLARERPQIAGVFISRLRAGMRLQSDPTIIYGLGASYDGDIRTRDLQLDGPYNSYTRDGLPPTPISLPGRAAIDAVLHPHEDGSLFFVATGAGDGSHVFSKDYAAHQAAVRSMLQGQRARGVIH